MAGSDRPEEGREDRPAFVSSTAPPARGCFAASAGPTAVPPEQQRIENVGFIIDVKKKKWNLYFTVATQI